jgi:micrococcal nuclease
MSSAQLTNLAKSAIPFVPPITEGIVIKVYDGDTITIVSQLPYADSPLYKFSIRINNIDCPEIRGSCDDEKECAQIAKKEVSDLILGKKVHLTNVGTEKYGRVLANVSCDGINIGEYLINSRLAMSYNGGTKRRPVSWMKYYSDGSFE